MTSSKHPRAHADTHRSALLRERAWRMRHAPTQSESRLWHALRGRQLGITFRRQVVLRGFIADFYASEANLIVEVDGEWHASRRADARRDVALRAAGYRVLRVSADAVTHSLPAVLAHIRAAL